MIWEILVGIVGAILLLVLLSFVMTSLTGFYQDLIERRFRDKISRPDLIPTISRFAAVVTISLLLIIFQILRMH